MQQIKLSLARASTEMTFCFQTFPIFPLDASCCTHRCVLLVFFWMQTQLPLSALSLNPQEATRRPNFAIINLHHTRAHRLAEEHARKFTCTCRCYFLPHRHSPKKKKKIDTQVYVSRCEKSRKQLVTQNRSENNMQSCC